MLSYVEEVCSARLAAQQVFQKNATEESMYIHGIIKILLGGKISGSKSALGPLLRSSQYRES